MPTLKDLRVRIGGVQNTQKITKAMKMVAAAKLRRATENILNARPYAKKISGMLSNLSTAEDQLSNIYFAEKPVKKVAVVVVTADRGLCGPFNSNLLREANRYIKEELVANGLQPALFCIGRKGNDAFKSTGYPILFSKTQFFNHMGFEDALQIYRVLTDGFLRGDFEKVVIIYNQFVSVVTSKVTTDQFLPIVSASNDSNSDETPYIYEPGKKEIFEMLIPEKLKMQVWKCLLDSNAAEHGARMAAMELASTNAQDLIKSLKLTYNKARQAAITKEILEVVSGANALKGQ